MRMLRQACEEDGLLGESILKTGLKARDTNKSEAFVSLRINVELERSDAGLKYE